MFSARGGRDPLDFYCFASLVSLNFGRVSTVTAVIVTARLRRCGGSKLEFCCQTRQGEEGRRRAREESRSGGRGREGEDRKKEGAVEERRGGEGSTEDC